VNLIERMNKLNDLFNELMSTDSRNNKNFIVKKFEIANPSLRDDMHFAFSVLNGVVKLGYTYLDDIIIPENEFTGLIIDTDFKTFYNNVLIRPATDENIRNATASTPFAIREIIANIVNRVYKVGYTDKDYRITELTPMLAKKYPETFEPYTDYYIQEKLDGNRCIAYFDTDLNKWQFKSRSGKQLKVDFDMSWANIDDIFDGEIMTLGKAGTRDFTETSGAINGKYTDKSNLHYYIYDIIVDDMDYKHRYMILRDYAEMVSADCTILKVLGTTTPYPNSEYNTKIEQCLEDIVAKGGEGIILRKANGNYEHKRSNNLLKYKKVQSMDLRIIDCTEGEGKYSGAIGAFVCETDDHNIQVKVAGITDNIRFDDPANYIGKIIEVEYFDISQSKENNHLSLRFPRFKCFRDDKNETSIY